jgi:hypothetical protein
MTNNIFAVTLCSISIICVISLACVKYFPHTVYNCDSVFFDEFPLSVQEECVRLLENDIRELIKRKSQLSSEKRHIQI